MSNNALEKVRKNQMDETQSQKRKKKVSSKKFYASQKLIRTIVTAVETNRQNSIMSHRTKTMRSQSKNYGATRITFSLKLKSAEWKN